MLGAIGFQLLLKSFEIFEASVMITCKSIAIFYDDDILYNVEERTAKI
jgi:hypothetical protein